MILHFIFEVAGYLFLALSACAMIHHYVLWKYPEARTKRMWLAPGVFGAFFLGQGFFIAAQAVAARHATGPQIETRGITIASALALFISVFGLARQYRAQSKEDRSRELLELWAAIKTVIKRIIQVVGSSAILGCLAFLIGVLIARIKFGASFALDVLHRTPPPSITPEQNGFAIQLSIAVAAAVFTPIVGAIVFIIWKHGPLKDLRSMTDLTCDAVHAIWVHRKEPETKKGFLGLAVIILATILITIVIHKS
jgi:hypothetical protein